MLLSKINGRMPVSLKKLFPAPLRSMLRRLELYDYCRSSFDPSGVYPVTAPMILISQLQRSGGSLLSQLFDGHPAILSYPAELMLVKDRWPRLDYSRRTADDYAETITSGDEMWRIFAVSGYGKYSSKAVATKVHTFEYDFLRRECVFRHLLRTRPFATQRDVIDAYMTAFFNGWRNMILPDGDVKYVCAFSPRTNMDLVSRQANPFFNVYPDGFIISLVRHPGAWLASAMRHNPSMYRTIPQSLAVWKESCLASQRLAALKGNVIPLVFEELVRDTPGVMEHLANVLGLEFTPGLSTPTFNREAVYSGSSFKPQAGIDKSPITRFELLDDGVQGCPEYCECIELYEAFVSKHGLASR